MFPAPFPGTLDWSTPRVHGRRTTPRLRLTPADHDALLTLARSPTTSAGLAKRARLILLLAEKMPLSHITDTVGISRRFVYKWIQRFQADGVASLYDRPGHNLIHRIPMERH